MNTQPTRTIKASMPQLLAMLGAMALAAFALAFAFALPAFANTQFGAPTTVSDDITRVHVNKLDADTHEFVSGAKMAIIDEETGEVIDEWVSGSSTHEYEKGSLVVDRVYILRELEAPEGFSKVDDVRFVVNAQEGTGLTILSGTTGQYERTSANVIALYDKAGVIENEIVVTETRATPSNTTTKAAAPKTGDETPLMPFAMFAVAGIATILILQVPKRKMD